MGTNVLATHADGTTIDASKINQFTTALNGNIAPRTSGTATDIAGSLGDGTYNWLKAFIESGYWNAGDIKTHHSYNGTVGPGHGWMLCDGRVINEANYNTEHGAGTWATYVGSSTLDGKYLPDLDGKYLVGADATTQTGGSAITAVGNTSSEIDFEHNHKWHNFTAGGVQSRSYDSNGDEEDIGTSSWTNNSQIAVRDGAVGDDIAIFASDQWTDNNLSATQDIRPESIEAQVYMRII